MNIKEYISSGILEAYVLGELSDIEKRDVEKNLAQFPELKEELNGIEEVHETILMKAAITPKASVKAELFQKIDDITTKIDIPAIAERKEKVISLSFWKFAAAASISVAIISSILAYTYWQKWRSTSSDLIALQNQNQKIASDYNRVNQQLDQLEADIRLIENPDFTRVVMKGTANSPEALASVYWNESTNEVFLRIQNMKVLASSNQYQLWAIIDGKPVDAGVFDLHTDQLLKMKNIGKGAVTFAVTIEPRGGNQSPSLETIQVAGHVGKS